MLVNKSAIIWQMSWSLVLNIFRDLCFRISQFRASVAYERKSVYTPIKTGSRCHILFFLLHFYFITIISLFLLAT